MSLKSEWAKGRWLNGLYLDARLNTSGEGGEQVGVRGRG
jgi:hypothetical protein